MEVALSVKAVESGKHLIVERVEDQHWCDLLGCDRVCECGATCEDHMEERTKCPTFLEDEEERAITEVRRRIA